MAGILNNKERIMDSLVTQLGREQAAEGVLKFRFASFTDYHTFYQVSGSDNVAADHTERLYFEAHSRPQDLIMPELKLGEGSRPFRAGDFELEGETLSSGYFNTGVELYPNVVTGSFIDEQSTEFIKSILNNFKDNVMLSTKDTFNDEVGFSVSLPEVVAGVDNSAQTFVYKDDRFVERRVDNNALVRTVFNDGAKTVMIKDAPNLFMDSKLNHLPNFKYLPPENIASLENPQGRSLGNYPQIENPPQTMEELSEDLNEKNRQFIRFGFRNTSRDNNLLIQAFEVSTHGENQGNFTKLDMIDYGEFHTTKDTERPYKRVFYIGKIINENDFDTLGARDTYTKFIHDNEMKEQIEELNSNSQSFFNIFTVILD